MRHTCGGGRGCGGQGAEVGAAAIVEMEAAQGGQAEGMAELQANVGAMHQQVKTLTQTTKGAVNVFCDDVLHAGQEAPAVSPHVGVTFSRHLNATAPDEEVLANAAAEGRIGAAAAAMRTRMVSEQDDPASTHHKHAEVRARPMQAQPPQSAASPSIKRASSARASGTENAGPSASPAKIGSNASPLRRGSCPGVTALKGGMGGGSRSRRLKQEEAAAFTPSKKKQRMSTSALQQESRERPNTSIPRPR